MLLLAVPVSIALARGALQKPNRMQIDSQLVVEFATETTTTQPQGFIFEHAQATYGPSILTADKLTVSLEPGHKHFIAQGHVHILDIDGTLDADEIDYDWIDHTGSGKNVHTNLQGLMVDASSVVIKNKICEMDGVFATPCGNDPHDLIAIKADKATIDENGVVHIFKPRLYLAGHKVLTLKEYTVAPNRRASGQPLPSFSDSRSNGLSMAWVPGIYLNDNLAANGSIHVSQKGLPSEDLLFSQGMMKPSQEPGGIVPYSDFAEHFGFSYFENVFVADPGIEHFFTAGRRESLSAGTVWDEYPVGRPVNEPFNKPVDLVYEAASPFGGFGTYLQLRAEQMQQINGPTENRLETFTSISLPDKDFFPDLHGLYPDVRFDGFSSLGDAKPFGWGHAQLGLVEKPNKYMRLGLAYTKASDYGTPLFITDELYRNQSVNMRADFMVGPRTLSLLFKYDPSQHDWYDTEFEVSQAMGCLEPYFIYRAFPQGYIFGLRLRLDNALDALKRRGALKTSALSEDR
jgi:hypothetical protein